MSDGDCRDRPSAPAPGTPPLARRGRSMAALFSGLACRLRNSVPNARTSPGRVGVGARIRPGGLARVSAPGSGAGASPGTRAPLPCSPRSRSSARIELASSRRGPARRRSRPSSRTTSLRAPQRERGIVRDRRRELAHLAPRARPSGRRGSRARAPGPRRPCSGARVNRISFAAAGPTSRCERLDACPGGRRGRAARRGSRTRASSAA